MDSFEQRAATVPPKPFPAKPFPVWAAIALALLAGLPFLVSRYPQLVDYPSHLARYHVMLDRGQSPWLAQHYTFDWLWTGNLGADILIWPLSALLGLERAAWLIGLLIPPLTGLGIVAAEWTLRRRIGIGAVLAMATIWSPAMAMGFYNFCLSFALALLAFAGWVRLEGWRWRAALYVPVGMVVWLCHVSGWGVLGVMVFGYEWHRRRNLSALLAPWPLFLPFAALLLGGEAQAGLDWGKNVASYKLGIWVKALRDQSLRLDLFSLLAIAIAVLAAARARRIDGRLGWAALILAVLTVVMPRHLGGGDFADWRLIAVTLTLACLAIDWQPPRWLTAAAALLFLARLGVTALAWQGQSRDLEQALTGLDRIPDGAVVAGAVLVNPGKWPGNPFEHAPSYAAVRRDALVNSHFALRGIHPLGLRTRGAEFADPSQRVFEKPGQPVDLANFAPARNAQFLWYFGNRRPDTLPAGAVVIHTTKISLLARLAKPGNRR